MPPPMSLSAWTTCSFVRPGGAGIDVRPRSTLRRPVGLKPVLKKVVDAGNTDTGSDGSPQGQDRRTTMFSTSSLAQRLDQRFQFLHPPDFGGQAFDLQDRGQGIAAAGYASDLCHDPLGPLLAALSSLQVAFDEIDQTLTHVDSFPAQGGH